MFFEQLVQQWILIIELLFDKQFGAIKTMIGFLGVGLDDLVNFFKNLAIVLFDEFWTLVDLLFFLGLDLWFELEYLLFKVIGVIFWCFLVLS